MSSQSRSAQAEQHKKGYFGEYGGRFIPELLVPALHQLEEAFEFVKADPAFNTELDGLLKNYAGRPTPLTLCKNFLADSPLNVYLKREDLLHGGAHKTNQVLAQALLTKHMGKTRVIAETGAGQHGVATAIACALLGLDATIYMGSKDVARQAPNVYRMRLMGAKVIPVDNGSGSLKDAINEAMRDWASSFENTHYLLGTAAGPHPFPTLVKQFQKVIGEEAKAQMHEQTGKLPDAVVACVGGGSNAIGIFADFIQHDEVRLIGVEPAGHGLNTDMHGATLLKGELGILHGAKTFVLQDNDGQIQESHSISAGLDYPAVGPEHAWLHATGRGEYVGVTDTDALNAFKSLSRAEGIIPALESAHALAYLEQMAQEVDKPMNILLNLSGRGDKDLQHVIDADKNHDANSSEGNVK